MSARLVVGKVLASLATLAFVVVFNFFLFRVVEGDPVANLYRGRNLTPEQREELRGQFGLDGSQAEQFARSARPDRAAEPRPLVHVERAGRGGDRPARLADDRARRDLDAPLGGLRRADRDRRGVEARVTDGLRPPTTFTMATYSMPDFWLGMLLLAVFAVGLGWFPVGGISDPGTATGSRSCSTRPSTWCSRRPRSTIAYLGEYAIVMRSSLLDTMREDYLVLARAKGLRDVLVRNRHAVPNALLPVVTLIAINFGFVLSGAIAVETIFSWPGLGLATYEALSGPDLPMLQGLFLVFSAAVILANLVADLLYARLDPRVRSS